MGLRGQHDGSFEVAHALAREGRRADFAGLSDRGALRPGRGRRRLERPVGGLVLPPRSIRRPASSFSTITTTSAATPSATSSRSASAASSATAAASRSSRPIRSSARRQRVCSRELAVDIKRFETAFDRDLYPSLGLSRGVFFPRETFGRDALVAGDAPRMNADETTRKRSNARPLAEFVADFPDFGGEQGAVSRALLCRARSAGRPQPPRRSSRCSSAPATATISPRSAAAARRSRTVLQGRTLGFFGLGADAVPAANVRDLGYPGFAGSGCRRRECGVERALHLSFPRRQRVACAPAGALAHPRHRAGQHHGRRGAGAVRLRQARRSRAAASASGSIRPASTCATPATRCGRLRARRHAASRRGAACGAGLLPHGHPAHHAGVAGAAARGAGEERQDADRLHQRAGAQLARVGEPQGQRRSPRRCRSTIRSSLDFPVSMGGYRTRAIRTQPICLHLVHVPGAPNQGLDARAQFRIGQGKLLAMTFADFEARIRDDLDRMLGPGRLFERARHRRDHGQPLAARLQLCGEHAVRPEDYETRCSSSRGSRSAASRSPTPTRAATPGCISRSTGGAGGRRI